MVQQRDIQDVLRIESDSSEFCWSERDFRDAAKGGAICLSAIEGEKVLGYVVFDSSVNRGATGGDKDVIILNLAVDRDFRRRGIGAKLIARAISWNGGHDCADVIIRETNEIALQFYRKLNFQGVGIVRGHYTTDDQIGDGIVLRWKKGT